jgi:hypothetical protein
MKWEILLAGISKNRDAGTDGSSAVYEQSVWFNGSFWS